MSIPPFLLLFDEEQMPLLLPVRETTKSARRPSHRGRALRPRRRTKPWPLFEEQKGCRKKYLEQLADNNFFVQGGNLIPLFCSFFLFTRRLVSVCFLGPGPPPCLPPPLYQFKSFTGKRGKQKIQVLIKIFSFFLSLCCRCLLRLSPPVLRQQQLQPQRHVQRRHAVRQRARGHVADPRRGHGRDGLDGDVPRGLGLEA